MIFNYLGEFLIESELLDQLDQLPRDLRVGDNAIRNLCEPKCEIS